MTCDSRYLTITGKSVSCAHTERHNIHEGNLGGTWFTWKTKHEIPKVSEPVIPTTYTPPKEKTEPVVQETASEKQVGGQHYKGSTLQPIDVIDAWKLDFYEGSALKYLARHRNKNGAEDIRKAIHYLELLLERQYSE